MLQFILAVILVGILFKVAQEDYCIGFGIYALLAVGFMIYTNNKVEYEDTQYQRDLLKTADGRRKYYYIINSQ